jgi:hypothetical protein
LTAAPDCLLVSVITEPEAVAVAKDEFEVTKEARLEAIELGVVAAPDQLYETGCP